MVPDTEFVIKVKNIDIEPGDSTGFSKTNSTGLKIQNYGNSKTYDFTFALAGEYLEDDFEYHDVSLPANGAHHIVPSLEDLMDSHLKILIDYDNDGVVDDSTYVTESSSDVDDTGYGNLPSKFMLYQNYPNPFNPITEIKFALPEKSQVKLEIFNILGQVVTTLADREFSAGNHSLTWNGLDENDLPVSSGIYMYRLSAGDYIATKKMMLLK